MYMLPKLKNSNKKFEVVIFVSYQKKLLLSALFVQDFKIYHSFISTDEKRESSKYS